MRGALYPLPCSSSWRTARLRAKKTLRLPLIRLRIAQFQFCMKMCVNLPWRVKRLRRSRGSVLAFGTQVRGFKPGRSRRIFQGEKIVKGSKAVCPMS